MFQDTPDLFFLASDNTTGMIQHNGDIHSTPNSQIMESETSFDSGYLSPAASAQKVPGTFIPLTNEHIFSGTGTGTFPCPPYHPSPGKPKIAFDDDWDKKFIENFEANLFGIDPLEDFSSEDINLFSELLSSPLKTGHSPARMFHGHSPAKYSRSPFKNLFSPPRSLQSRTNLFAGNNWNANEASVASNNNMATFSRPVDPIPFTPHVNSTMNSADFTQHYQPDQRLSAHDYAKPHTVCYSVAATQQTPNYTQSRSQPATESTGPSSNSGDQLFSNLTPDQMPSKQKLQYVRAKFKQTLQKAVENADKAALNEEKYPQLTKRLSKSSTAGPVSIKENYSSFTETHHLGEKSSSLSALDIADSQSSSASKRFRELAPSQSGKRTFACIVNNQYEVKEQTDCRVVIKKRRTY